MTGSAVRGLALGEYLIWWSANATSHAGPVADIVLMALELDTGCVMAATAVSIGPVSQRLNWVVLKDKDGYSFFLEACIAQKIKLNQTEEPQVTGPDGSLINALNGSDLWMTIRLTVEDTLPVMQLNTQLNTVETLTPNGTGRSPIQEIIPFPWISSGLALVKVDEDDLVTALSEGKKMLNIVMHDKEETRIER